MFQDLLNEWIKYWEEKYSQKVDMSQMFCAINFATWLDSRSPTLRAPVHAEQKCPFCKGDGYWHTAESETKWCDMCAGTGISKRSAGG